MRLPEIRVATPAMPSPPLTTGFGTRRWWLGGCGCWVLRGWSEWTIQRALIRPAVVATAFPVDCLTNVAVLRAEPGI